MKIGETVANIIEAIAERLPIVAEQIRQGQHDDFIAKRIIDELEGTDDELM